MQNAISLFQEPFIRESKNELSQLYQDLCRVMLHELNFTVSEFYQYPTDKGLSGDRVFELIEQSYVGLLSNAVVRYLNSPTIQEFAVYKDGVKLEGRCDMLFGWKAKHIIVEAKAWTFMNDWAKNSGEDFYTPILTQAQLYYDTEMDRYIQETHALVIGFERVYANMVSEAETEFKRNWCNNLKSTPTDFLALYKGDKQGLFVYGKSQRLYPKT